VLCVLEAVVLMRSRCFPSVSLAQSWRVLVICSDCSSNVEGERLGGGLELMPDGSAGIGRNERS
jgi:hypothetical protein